MAGLLWLGFPAPLSWLSVGQLKRKWGWGCVVRGDWAALPPEPDDWFFLLWSVPVALPGKDLVCRSLSLFSLSISLSVNFYLSIHFSLSLSLCPACCWSTIGDRTRLNIIINPDSPACTI